MYLGVTVGGLVVFRLLWGIWGSDTARFTQFVPPGRGGCGITCDTAIATDCVWATTHWVRSR